jgi:hypothetical protein
VIKLKTTRGWPFCCVAVLLCTAVFSVLGGLVPFACLLIVALVLDWQKFPDFVSEVVLLGMLVGLGIGYLVYKWIERVYLSGLPKEGEEIGQDG